MTKLSFSLSQIKKSNLALSFVLALFLLTVSPLFVGALYSPSVGAGASLSSASALTVQPAPLIMAYRSPNVPTCSPSGLCPAMLQKAYGFDILQKSGINGKGQTILIDDACGDPSITTDLSTFDSQFSLTNPTLKVIYPEGSKGLCVSGGWAVETALDVEWSHVTAPGAAIDLLVANQPSAPDMYTNWNYALKHNLGNQISNSYGGAGCFTNCNYTIGQGIGPCTLTNGTQGFNISNVLAKAAKQHLTVLASSGDGGYWGLGTPNEEPIPGDCKGVLTIGGTQLSVDSSGNYLGESGWGGCSGASGGGYVTPQKEPTYQKAAKISDSFGTLAKPDVAADASPCTGVWEYQGGWFVVGGTSLSSPLWCGFMADVNQIRAGNGFSAAGFINPFLYTSVYGKASVYKSDFHDITTGNNGWPAGKGWDAVTGLGSFIAPKLAGTLGNSKNA